MMDKGKITNRQVIILLIIFISSTAIIFLPAVVYKEAKQDGWLTFIPFGMIGAIVAYLVTSLGMMFKDKTIIQYSEIILGKVLGKVVGLIISVFFISINAIIIREFCEITIGPFFTNTPVLFFSITIMILSIYAVYGGIECIARVNEIIFPLFSLAIIGIILLAIREMDLKNFTPILAEGFLPVLKGTYKQSVFATEIFVLAMLLPHINKPEKAKKSGFITMGMIVFLAMFITMGMVSVLGDEMLHLRYPFLTLARYVHVRGVLERVESLVVFMWVAGVFIKIAVFHYCGVMALTQVLNLQSYKKLIIPIGILLIGLSQIIFKNIAQFAELMGEKVTIPFVSVEAGIPLVLFILAKFRKKAISKKLNSQ